MAQFLALTCLSCEGKLHIREDNTEFDCPYCGTTHLLNKINGMVSMHRAANMKRNFEKALNNATNDAEIKRLHGELLRLPHEGNFDRIKSELWHSKDNAQSVLVQFALMESLIHLLKQADPQRTDHPLKSAFLGEFSEREIKHKFFSHLSEADLEEMINFCNGKMAKENYLADAYNSLKSKFKTIIAIYEINHQIAELKK